MFDPPRDSSVLARFQHHVAARPDAVAVVHERRQLTYGELDAYSSRVAGWLRDRGGARPDRSPFVPFCLGKGPEQIVALLAILKVGSAYVPIDRHAPPVRNRQILEDLGADLLLTDAATHNDMLELLRDHPRAL